MAKKYILELTLTGHVEQGEDGRWVSYNNEFGFITYGKSQQQAIREASKAFDMVIDAYLERSEPSKLGKWLEKKGVAHSLRIVQRVRPIKPTKPTLLPWGKVERYQFIERRPLAAAV